MILLNHGGQHCAVNLRQRNKGEQGESEIAEAPEVIFQWS
jgi:hypothetical protein